jgi:rubrerythrin
MEEESEEMGMRNFTPQQILNRAIGKEVEAKTLYELYARKVQDKQSKKLLQELAQEELGHKQILEKIDPDKPGTFTKPTIAKSEFADFTERAEMTKEATMQEVLRFAIGEEVDAFNFYTSILPFAGDEKTRNLLNRIANEEKKHKQRLEKLYDDMFQPEN